MNRILEREALNPTVTRLKVEAPLIARKAEPGQFVILRTDEDGERIPLTVADFDREEGSVTVIFQVVGATTEKLNHLQPGDMLHDFVGPLGRATHTEGLKKVAVVGGGVGCAIAYPVTKKLHEQGCEVHAIVGFRNQDLVILEKEFRQASSRFVPMSDDGSWGEKGLVTDALRKLIESGEQYDEVITIGPLIMMKFVCKLPPDRGRQNALRLRGRSGVRRPRDRLRRSPGPQRRLPGFRAPCLRRNLQPFQGGEDRCIIPPSRKRPCRSRSRRSAAATLTR